MDTTLEVLDLLRRISAQLEALPAAITAAVQRDRPTLNRADRQALSALLPAIATIRPAGTVFTSAEAIGHARTVPAVQAPLEAVIGSLDSANAPRRLGKMLSRAEGCIVEDLLIVRSVALREGQLWQVRRV